MFRAARIDYSLYRLYHYTGTDPEYFQNFVIFTNYQFYVDAFARLGYEHVASTFAFAQAPKLCRGCIPVAFFNGKFRIRVTQTW